MHRVSCEFVRWLLRLLHISLPRLTSFYSFNGFTLYVPRGVFIPVYTYSTALMARSCRAYGRVADFGCGSGALSIAFASRESVEAVYAYDVNPYALAATKINAKINGVERKVFICPTKRCLENSKPFDTFVSNPPYLPIDPLDDLDRNWCSGRDLEAVREAVETAKQVLKPSGKLCLSASTLTGIEKVVKIMKMNKFKVETIKCVQTPVDKVCAIEAYKE